MHRKEEDGSGWILFLVVIVFILINAGSVISSAFMNTPLQTEALATKNMEKFITSNQITKIKRKSCAYDSDNNGYGSCVVALQDEQKIYLECPAKKYVFVSSPETCKETIPLYNPSRNFIK